MMRTSSSPFGLYGERLLKAPPRKILAFAAFMPGKSGSEIVRKPSPRLCQGIWTYIARPGFTLLIPHLGGEDKKIIVNGDIYIDIIAEYISIFCRDSCSDHDFVRVRREFKKIRRDCYRSCKRYFCSHIHCDLRIDFRSDLRACYYACRSRFDSLYRSA